LLEEGVKPDLITYNALISAFGKAKQPEQALETLQTMKRQGVVPDVITCNALISACERGKRAAQAWKVF